MKEKVPGSLFIRGVFHFSQGTGTTCFQFDFEASLSVFILLYVFTTLRVMAYSLLETKEYKTRIMTSQKLGFTPFSEKK